VKMSEIKYIFSINSGRCGSDYLSKVFTAINGCNSNHEAEPIGNGEVLQNYNKGCFSEMRELGVSKFSSIASENITGIYSDTSHLFIQGIGWYMPEVIPEENVGMVVLTRDKESVVKSFYRIGSTPLTNSGKKWLIELCKKDPIIKPPKVGLLSVKQSYYFSVGIKKLISRFNRNLGAELKEPKFLIDYELNSLRWYYDEIHALGKNFLIQYPNIKSYTIDIEQLNDFDEVTSMFDFFGLSYDIDELGKLVGNSTNRKLYVNDNK